MPFHMEFSQHEFRLNVGNQDQPNVVIYFVVTLSAQAPEAEPTGLRVAAYFGRN